MDDPEKRSSFDKFDARFNELRSKNPEPDKQEARSVSWGDGFQAGLEIVSGVIGGVLIGWALDSWLETAPLMIILFFLLGAVAGLLNAYRWLKRWNERTNHPGGQ